MLSSKFLRIFSLQILAFVILAAPAKADSLLSIQYNGDDVQTVVVQPTTFAKAIFTGSVTNISSQPVTFELIGGPEPFEPFVASFETGIPFPGITLGPCKSTGIINLAIVMINPFDPSLTYPGTVNIVLPALDPHTGNTLSGGQNTATLFVVTRIPEPAGLLLLGIALLAIGLLRRRSRV